MDKKKMILTMRLAIVAVLVLLIGGYFMQYHKIQKNIRIAEENLGQLQETLDDLTIQEAALNSDLEFSMTDAFKERVARDELGYVKEGEIKFIEEK